MIKSMRSDDSAVMAEINVTPFTDVLLARLGNDRGSHFARREVSFIVALYFCGRSDTDDD
jgi:hypothetical protein